MIGNTNRFTAALRCENDDCPPVWMMRQAGRVLPEYRALREKHSFLEIARTPDLCAEVTLQPIQRFGFDAAIIFSDILVIPEALGQHYSFQNQKGISMDFCLDPNRFETQLQWDARVTDRLSYVREALQLVRTQLDPSTALLGFAGSPWTLACFMLEGGHVPTDKPSKALDWYRRDPQTFDAFMSQLAEKVSEYLLMQWNTGIDSAQIFDSLSLLIPEADYWNISGKYIARILASLGAERPMIVYSKGSVWKHYLSTSAQVFSVDWTQSIPEVAVAAGPHRCVQGNLNPELMTQTPEIVCHAVKELLRTMSGHPGFILNLGHGLLPDSKLECIEAFIQTARQKDY
ncbi:MAG: uroporphyrinogen decarboxylase [Verrucomicrobia bacterium]|nr:uroporphyrinogen decarboxylase [Verrucomicrobiota bacterium]